MKEDTYITEKIYKLFLISGDGLLKFDTESGYQGKYNVLDSEYISEDEAMEDLNNTYPDSFAEFAVIPMFVRRIVY